MKLIDKLTGALVGYAFGDALGLGTEFMTRQEVQTYYPGGLSKFSQIIRDAHRIQWKRGEWTNDTELAIQMLECIVDTGGFDILAQARTMKRWLATTDIDVCPKIRIIAETAGWEEHPIAVSHQVWQHNGWYTASNEAIPRALVTGLGCTYRELNESTRQLVLMTNDETRCVSTVLILAKMIHSLLHEECEPSFESLLEICRTVDPRTTAFLEKAHDGDIESLKIDDPETWSWTRKSMAAALWGFWHGKNPVDSILKVINLGGDSGSNASLTGAMVGIKYGYDALPMEKENLKGKERLFELAERLAKYLHG